ncbi:hypothetical protein PICSAR240_01828 [Mycobacterium avium subsp. paratuberculosis]|nr:hypothetical protein MAP44135_0550 [Mycobacterium avium subsp. paratuberculosis]CAG6865579.1 hypothetical protein PICSAR117_00893 [Mycobacterium avium subsp. paratuberculosis]CAG6872554.1 hypothetical protein PICSAR124_00899 [Mycobacterium avium subsp. paratuberculosis]CAG6874265.1 hypothetical protein PICSAR124B_01371 [Mycobacterium avium subsp. paratuberculosis]CAG6874744.1 hypothetical protein PICSAR11_01324 [Mycobacterium avium subsp. paratuberculosis]
MAGAVGGLRGARADRGARRGADQTAARPRARPGLHLHVVSPVAAAAGAAVPDGRGALGGSGQRRLPRRSAEPAASGAGRDSRAAAGAVAGRGRRLRPARRRRRRAADPGRRPAAGAAGRTTRAPAVRGVPPRRRGTGPPAQPVPQRGDGGRAGRRRPPGRRHRKPRRGRADRGGGGRRRRRSGRAHQLRRTRGGVRGGPRRGRPQHRTRTPGRRGRHTGGVAVRPGGARRPVAPLRAAGPRARRPVRALPGQPRPGVPGHPCLDRITDAELLAAVAEGAVAEGGKP